jgi:hypothetical protein
MMMSPSIEVLSNRQNRAALAPIDAAIARRHETRLEVLSGRPDGGGNDVFRAFTSAAVALANGALSIVMVRTVEEAVALRDAGIGHICMGEVHGRAPPGFVRRLAFRDFRRRFRRQDNPSADQHRDSGHCRRCKMSRTALRGLAGHGRGNRPCTSLGLTRSDLSRRDGGQWPQPNRRRRTLRHPPSQPA